VAPIFTYAGENFATSIVNATLVLSLWQGFYVIKFFVVYLVALYDD